MKKYRFLLFDADNTLLDFDAAEKMALAQLFEEQNLTLSEDIDAHYKRINEKLWQAYEKGEIEREEVLNTRFSITFQHYGKEADGAFLEERFRSYLMNGHQLIDGAFELVTNLTSKYDLYIVTNGVADTQDMRLRDSGLIPLFKDVFVSENLGFQKPMKEYFDAVFQRIPNFSLEETLIIGDSLSSDVKGGENAGIDTCWFNPNNVKNTSNLVPSYEIKSLFELYPILGE